MSDEFLMDPGKHQQRRSLTPARSDTPATSLTSISSSSGAAAHSSSTTSGPQRILSETGALSPAALLPVRPVPVIQNIVASAMTGCSLDPKDIAVRAWNTEYDAKKPSVVKLRLRSPRCTALVYKIGKILISGVLSIPEAQIATKKVACILKSLGYAIQYSDFQIRNMVALMDVQFPIQLDSLRRANPANAQYETEIFPALVYRSVRPSGHKLAAMIFCNGKVVMTGLRSVEDMDATAQFLVSLVLPHRLNVPIPSHPSTLPNFGLSPGPIQHQLVSFFIWRLTRLLITSTNPLHGFIHTHPFTLDSWK